MKFKAIAKASLALGMLATGVIHRMYNQYKRKQKLNNKVNQS
ncbi:hypothetical protein ACVPOW_14245 [Staphylococcus aureus]